MSNENDSSSYYTESSSIVMMSDIYSQPQQTAFLGHLDELGNAPSALYNCYRSEGGPTVEKEGASCIGPGVGTFTSASLPSTLESSPFFPLPGVDSALSTDHHIHPAPILHQFKTFSQPPTNLQQSTNRMDISASLSTGPVTVKVDHDVPSPVLSKRMSSLREDQIDVSSKIAGIGGKAVSFTHSNGQAGSPSSSKGSPSPSSNSTSRGRSKSSHTHKSRHHRHQHDEDNSDSGQNVAIKQTRIILKVIEEILVDGVVVESTVNTDKEIITQGGCIPWSGHSAKIADDVSEAPVSTSTIANNRKEVSQKSSRNSSKEEKSKVKSSSKSRNENSKRPHNLKADVGTSSKKPKKEVVDESEESEDDRRMIETASTLLALHTEGTPVKMKASSPVQEYNFSDLVFQPLKQGNSVLAKWTDKNFYPGVLGTSLGDGRWNILFEDGGKKIVQECDIISIPHLTVGQVVMATFSDGSLCLKGMIRKGFQENGRVFYEVEYNDGSRVVVDKFCKKDIFLTHDMAAPLLNKRGGGNDKMSKFADVDLNNIIPKRSRTSALSKPLDGTDSESESQHATAAVHSPAARSSTSSSTQKPRSRTHNKKSSHNHSSSSRLSSTSTAPSTPLRRDSNNSNHSTTSSLEGLPTSFGQPTLTAIKEVSPKERKDKAEPLPSSTQPASSTSVTSTPSNQLLGPIPDEGTGLFQGIAFLLTTADATGNPNDSDKDGQGRSTAPFDIPHLVRQIECGGGRVFQTLEEAQKSPDCKEIVLLAYTYLRTVKYMQCLAAGIPCLMHSYVIECCKQNKALKRDDFILPSGYSIITSSLVTDKQVFKRSSTLFRNTRFMLVSKNPRHSESWTSVLKAANAIVVDDFPPNTGKDSTKVDIVISDSTCPQRVIQKASELGVPIVTSEYVVQCLINGKRLPCTAHEKFGINFKASQAAAAAAAHPSSSTSSSTVSRTTTTTTSSVSPSTTSVSHSSTPITIPTTNTSSAS